ncbi:asparagine--tRNA ligase [Gracilaria domingensis]|nr:asparagine--tRNA ligase [Gracilaria domingensis]
MAASFVSPQASRLFASPLRSFRSAFLKPVDELFATRTVAAIGARRLPYATAAAPTEQASKSPPALPRTRLNAVTPERVGSTLCVKGWVRSVRAQKAFAFIDLNDGTSLAGLQIVVDGDAPCFPLVSSLSTGCSISAVGELVASLGSAQPVELRASALNLIGAAAEYPLQKKRHSLEFLRSIAHLRPRTNSIAAVSRIRSALAVATHAFFAELGFVYVHAPLITASDCEGAGEMFRVTTALNADGTPAADAGASGRDGGDSASKVDFRNDFFGKPAFLTVSGQLSAECFATALGDVYTFGPTFRAENSNTSRHLAEFWMIEPEMAFADLKDDMDNAERLVKYLVSYVLQKCEADVAFFDRFVQKGLLQKLNTVANEPFARLSYTEAIEILEKVNKPNKKGKRRFEFEVKWGVDLQSEHERYLAEEHFDKPVFVYNYPSAIKAFYMRANDEDGGKTCAAMDLLVPGIGELVGGSQREERLDVLEEKIERNGLEKEAYWWYLDLRRFGSVPHSGYGLGFERLVQFVTGMENIRDVIPFPRYPGNAEF